MDENEVVWERRGLVMIPVSWTETPDNDRPNHRRGALRSSPLGDGEYLGIPEVATLLGVTPQAVRNWRSNRKDPAHPSPEPDGVSPGKTGLAWRADRAQEWLEWYAAHRERALANRALGWMKARR